MKVNANWLWTALKLVLLAAVTLAIATGCRPVAAPDEEGEKGTYLELAVGYPGVPRLIEVKEYPVTSLLIEVTGPDGEVIQTILWQPADGPQRYRIPVRELGEHEVAVAHRSKTDTGQIEAVESEKFFIAPMIITEVRIVPGAVGYIVIDAEQRAADLKAREVLPEILEQAEPSRYVVSRLPRQLPKGTNIVEDIPDDSTTPGQLVLDEDSYLYYLDMEPGAYYEHKVKYLLVGKSGETKVLDAEWWPRIDEKVPEPLVSPTPKLVNLIERNTVVELPSSRIIHWQIKPGLISLLSREAFVCVQGLRPTESLYTDAVTTYQNVYNFFDAYRPGLSTVVGLTDYSADNVLTEIDTLAAAGYDVITIYVIAHGGNNYVRLGGVAVTAAQFAAKMASYPSIQFNFLCGSCHSGSFVDELQAEANVRVVETACTAAESAWPDKDVIGSYTDTNSSDTGSEWTSSLFEAAQVLTSNATLWNSIVSKANTYSVPRTSVLLNEAGYLGAGLNRGLGTPLINYDLTYEAGWSTPQHYNSYEILP